MTRERRPEAAHSKSFGGDSPDRSLVVRSACRLRGRLEGTVRFGRLDLDSPAPQDVVCDVVGFLRSLGEPMVAELNRANGPDGPRIPRLTRGRPTWAHLFGALDLVEQVCG